MNSYKNINLESQIKQYYGEGSTEYERLINVINNQDSHFKSDELNPYIEEISKYPKLSLKQQRQYVDEYLSGNEQAKQIIINNNLFYVVLIALEYIGNGISLEDLIQEGNIGLMHALNTINYSNKDYLTRYINIFVNREIKKAIKTYQNNKIVKKNLNRYELTKYIKESTKESSFKKIIDLLSNTINENTESNDDISLNIKTEEGFDLDNIISTDIYNPENLILSKEQQLIDFYKVFDICKLTDNQKEYLEISWGLLDNRIKTNVETSRILNISKQRGIQIKQESIKKIKENKKIKDMYYNNKLSCDTTNQDIIDYKKSKKRVLLYVKKFVYLYFDNQKKEDIDSILYALSSDELRTLENAIKTKDNNLEQELLNILNKISTKLNTNDNKKREIDIRNNPLLKKANKKAEFVCNIINKYSTLNKLNERYNNIKHYKLLIDYNKNYSFDKEIPTYIYNIKLIEDTKKDIKTIIDIKYELYDYQNGLDIIIKIINNFKENNKISSAYFDGFDNSIITDDLGIKIITKIKTIFEKERFKTLHEYLKKDNIINNYNSKIKKLEK